MLKITTEMTLASFVSFKHWLIRYMEQAPSTLIMLVMHKHKLIHLDILKFLQYEKLIVSRMYLL